MHDVVKARAERAEKDLLGAKIRLGEAPQEHEATAAAYHQSQAEIKAVPDHQDMLQMQQASAATEVKLTLGESEAAQLRGEVTQMGALRETPAS